MTSLLSDQKDQIDSVTNDNHDNAVIEEPTLPEAMPHFSGILEDPNGRIWVEEWTWPRTEARRWRIFTGEGEAIAELHVPRSFMIRQVDSDSVLGVWSDDLDVQYIRRYQIIR